LIFSPHYNAWMVYTASQPWHPVPPVRTLSPPLPPSLVVATLTTSTSGAPFIESFLLVPLALLCTLTLAGPAEGISATRDRGGSGPPWDSTKLGSEIDCVNWSESTPNRRRTRSAGDFRHGRQTAMVPTSSSNWAQREGMTVADSVSKSQRRCKLRCQEAGKVSSQRAYRVMTVSQL